MSNKLSQNTLPTTEQLQNCLHFLINGAKQKTFTLTGWGIGDTRFPIGDQACS